MTEYEKLIARGLLALINDTLQVCPTNIQQLYKIKFDLEEAIQVEEDQE